MPQLLCQAISRHSPALQCVTVADEARALCAAIDSMEPGEVVVLFYEHLDTVREFLVQRGAAPATRVDPLPAAEDGVYRFSRRA